MFTGIVEERAALVGLDERVRVSTTKVGADAAAGDSISVSGVCLTVADRTDSGGCWLLGLALSGETRRRASVRGRGEGEAGRAGRPVTLLQRLGGHLVQGHV